MKYDPLEDGISCVEYEDHMGTDLSVVDAARVSFDKRSYWETPNSNDPKLPRNILKDNDKKLISYLANHDHWSPFAHTSIKMRVKAPIFVARQLVKHQVGFAWNEVSRRYVDSPPEIYIPKELHGRPENMKQGAGGVHEESENAVNYMIENADRAVMLYNDLLKAGIAPEEARMVLPLSLYTEWIWTGSLMAWVRVVKLRIDSHAQSHVQVYGQAFAKVIGQLFPVSTNALLGAP